MRTLAQPDPGRAGPATGAHARHAGAAAHGPLTRAQILGGKALACFVAILIVELMLPCAILAGIGLACVAIGTRGLKDA